MAQDTAHTAAFRGAAFHDADLNAASFRECDLRNARIVGSWVDGLSIWAFAGRLGPVTVEGVDVTAFVLAELDRRQPERVLLREGRTADDVRTTAAAVLSQWESLVTRGGGLGDAVRTARVDGEWSLAQTLRHLAFAVDVWVRRLVLDEPHPYDAAVLPPTDFPAEDAPAVGIDLCADPSWDEVVALWRDRAARMRAVLGDLSDEGLDDERTAELPTPQWGVETHTVRECLTTVLREHLEHHRYATRDLALLESRSG